MNVDQIRFAIFLGVFVFLLGLEWMIPRHPTVDSKLRRLGINLGLTGVNIVLVKLFLSTAAVGTAAFAAERGWGLFNFLDWPVWIEVVLTVVFFDFMIYLQHVVVHMIPFFWRFHIVHHSDLDLDVSSALRFHPVEILGSMLFKMGLVLAIGPSVLAVILFEAVLNGMAQFTHSNIYLPEPLDRALRRLIVTPDMHRIHHSEVMRETNSNYGFNLSIWDRMLGTYIADAQKAQPEIVIGVPQYKRPEQLTFRRVVMLPLSAAPQGAPPRPSP
ncbi:sterol desaturase family protein [Nitrospina gracilis]|uniref:sterol desaturase family protein n=1 Tax=Nitrospina gracilis TaxID=35801 RepID=UPI001F352C0E|nr:sterol desaturase family protein [Nitrospina gracilis]MCF8719963.1 sterol desaturase/sphingolipid hydroxylase (fatty acid hydroxylase superfamily) [Nitrospina gracilis Nb-211]